MESKDFRDSKQIQNEANFFLRILAKEAVKRGISLKDLEKKGYITYKDGRLISRNTIVKIFKEWELLVIDGITVNMKLGDLQQFKAKSISNIATASIANSGCKIELQKDDRLGLCDLEGNVIGTLPLPSSDIFLTQMIPKYLEVIEKKKNSIRIDFGEIEGELRNWLTATHGIGKIGENRFLKWFIDKIDQTVIKGYGTFIISKTATEFNWFFTKNEFTPDVIEEHLNAYCLYVKSKTITEIEHKEISISKENIELIYNALSPYFIEQKTKLRDLLEGKTIGGKVIFNDSAKVLCNTFNTLQQAGKIGATIEQIKVWLCNYFQTNRKPYDLSQGKTLDRYFQEIIERDRQILLPTIKSLITFDKY
ncbi:MAG: hypothetical protein U0X91_20555 [Spirosomataceae bacterium]